MESGFELHAGEGLNCGELPLPISVLIPHWNLG